MRLRRLDKDEAEIRAQLIIDVFHRETESIINSPTAKIKKEITEYILEAIKDARQLGHTDEE
jgi:hypothetical protein